MPPMKYASARDGVFFGNNIISDLIGIIADRRLLPKSRLITQRDVTPVLSDDAALWFYLRDKRGS